MEVSPEPKINEASANPSEQEEEEQPKSNEASAVSLETIKEEEELQKTQETAMEETKYVQVEAAATILTIFLKH